MGRQLPFRGLYLLMALWLGLSAVAAQAQVTAISYQGKLTDAGNPANGSFDMLFDLYDSPTVGTGTHDQFHALVF